MLSVFMRKIGGLIWKTLQFDTRVDSHLSMSAIDIAIDSIVGKQLNGDYFEFGVYDGNSFARVYNRFKSKNSLKGRRFFAFDSFEGLPDSDEEYKPQQYAEFAYSQDEKSFLENIRRKGVSPEFVITVKGFYNESLPLFSKANPSSTKIALAYIDCDLYSSTVDVLNFITPYLQLGTILVIDDWFAHTGTPNTGIQKAVKEWLILNPNIKLIHLHTHRRVAFIVDLISCHNE